MRGEWIPPDANVDKLNASLSEGLKSCRSMVANYRALLTPPGDRDESPAEAERSERASEDSSGNDQAAIG